MLVWSHPSWVCGLKQKCDIRMNRHTSHTLRGCVGWNLMRYVPLLALISHTLRGCVGWNTVSISSIALPCVTPFVGVWVETFSESLSELSLEVTPFVGVWVETIVLGGVLGGVAVTPFVGVWVETYKISIWIWKCFVTPFVGVWVETDTHRSSLILYVSHPSWVCGLKLRNLSQEIGVKGVTPFVGVWIETLLVDNYLCP